MKKLTNNASYVAHGFIYQFYVALDSCFDLAPGEAIYIETFGDVTSPNEFQAEVKTSSIPLRENSDNLWKTLNNWMQSGFKVETYKHLYLITTQKIAPKSKLKNWNNETFQQKLEILKEAAKEFEEKKKTSTGCSDKQLWINNVLDPAKSEKLILTLERFEILSDSKSLKDKCSHMASVKLKLIPTENREKVLNELFGFVCSKSVGRDDGWKITYEDFTQACQNLSATYGKKGFVFPEVEIRNSDPKDYSERNFVKKIQEIQCDEEEIGDAVRDFLKTKETIARLLSDYSCSKESLDSFEKVILDLFERTYRSKRKYLESMDAILLSQKFYDEMTVKPPKEKLPPLEGTAPIYFRNGVIHGLTDSEDYNLKWLIVK